MGIENGTLLGIENGTLPGGLEIGSRHCGPRGGSGATGAGAAAYRPVNGRLSQVACLGVVPIQDSLRVRSLSPCSLPVFRLERLLLTQSILNCFKTMASDPERVLNGGVDREKTLRQRFRPGSPHSALSFPGVLVGHLDPVVAVLSGSADSRQVEFLAGTASLAAPTEVSTLHCEWSALSPPGGPRFRIVPRPCLRSWIAIAPEQDEKGRPIVGKPCLRRRSRGDS